MADARPRVALACLTSNYAWVPKGDADVISLPLVTLDVGQVGTGQVVSRIVDWHTGRIARVLQRAGLASA